MRRSYTTRNISLLAVVFALTLLGSPRPIRVAAAEGSDATASALAEKPPTLLWQSGHASPVNVVSFSPDGKLLASGSGSEWAPLEKNALLLWDVATGTQLRIFRPGAPVKWIGFSPDGRRVAIKNEANSSKIMAWDIVNGDELTDEKDASKYVAYPVSPDGNIAADTGELNINLRNTTTNKPLRTLLSRTSDFQKVMFSPDSTILASGGTRLSIRLWDLRSGTLRTLVGHTDFPIAADFSPDSRLFASGGRDLTVRIWDVASGREIKKLEGHNGINVRGIKFSPNGKTLLSSDRAGFKLWDVASGRELLAAAGDFDLEMKDAFFSPQGNFLAAQVGDKKIMWEIETGKEVRRIPSHGGYLFTRDGKILAIDDGDETIKLCDVASGEQLAVVDTSVVGVISKLQLRWAAFSPDSRTLAVSQIVGANGEQRAWRMHLIEVPTGKLLHTIDVDDTDFDNADTLVFTADGKEIMKADDAFTVWNVATAEKSRTFKISNTMRDYFQQLWPLAPHHLLDSFGAYCPVSANGAYFVHIGDAGELYLFDTKTWSWFAALVGIDEKEWVVATEDGFFDGSPAAWKAMYWRFNNDTFNFAPLEAFFNEYYYPGLLPDLLAGKRPKLPDGKDMSRIDRRQPKVTLSQVAAKGADRNAAEQKRTVTLAIDIEENGTATRQTELPPASGVRDVRLFRNGSLVKAWRGNVFSLDDSDGCQQLPAKATDTTKRVRCEVRVPIVAGANAFTAYAFNDANVKSADATISITGADSLSRTPTLHVLAIGVNQYDYQPLNLKYAVADAQGFAAEVTRQQESLPNFANVETTLLTDGHATKASMLSALEAIAAKAQPEDTVIVYFAGHGTAQGNQFYLIPHDIGYAEDSPQNNDDGIHELLRRSISDRELEKAFEQVDAAQILFVIDACNSGQALEADEKRCGPMNSKGLAQLAYDKGMYVLTAAQGFQAAQEVSKLGHGLFTYVLVEEGLKLAAADSEPQDKLVDIREWLDYATRRVPEVQLHEMHLAQSRGANLAFVDDEQKLSLAMRTGQRPRAFYRREVETQPLVMSKSLIPAEQRNQLALEADQLLAQPITPPIEVHPVVVAVADSTLMGQPLPKNVKDQWHKRIRALNEKDRSSFELVDDPANAEWLIQVAALERTDVIYLVPSKEQTDKSGEESLLMSPPGEAALPWLNDELQQLARSIDPLKSLAQSDINRGAFLGIFRKGPAEDLKAEIVEEQSAVYHTPNCTQALIGTYGKAIEGKRLLGRLPKFEQRGVVQQLDQIRRFETVHRQGRGKGKDFLSLFGSRQAWQVVDIGAQVAGGREQEVSFEVLGVRLEQSDVINALNADADALNYFDFIKEKDQTPCVVLENVMLTNYAATQTTNVSLGVNAQTVISTDSVKAETQNERTTSTQLVSPVIRCYQMYMVKLHQNRVVELVHLDP